MNKNLKLGLILLIFASVYFLTSSVAFFILKENEREKRVYLEDEIKDVLGAKETIEKELTEVKLKNRELEEKLNSVKEQAKSIADEVLKEKEARGLIAKQLEEEKKKAEKLLADVMSEKEERLNIVHQLSKSEESYRQLKTQFDLVAEAKATLEKKLRELLAGKGVELERIEVKSDYMGTDVEDSPIEEPEQEAVPARTERTGPPPETVTRKAASILVVNQKYNFVVSNIGKVDGVDIGTELDVYRGDTFIARAKVEKLYDKMSAATILPEWKNARISEGDQAILVK